MNWNIVEGSWKQFKGRLKAQWGWLTRQPHAVVAGKRVAQAGKAQAAYGISEGESDKKIERLAVPGKRRSNRRSKSHAARKARSVQ